MKKKIKCLHCKGKGYIIEKIKRLPDWPDYHMSKIVSKINELVDYLNKRQK